MYASVASGIQELLREKEAPGSLRLHYGAIIIVTVVLLYEEWSYFRIKHYHCYSDTIV